MTLLDVRKVIGSSPISSTKKETTHSGGFSFLVDNKDMVFYLQIITYCRIILVAIQL